MDQFIFGLVVTILLMFGVTAIIEFWSRITEDKVTFRAVGLFLAQIAVIAYFLHRACETHVS